MNSPYPPLPIATPVEATTADSTRPEFELMYTALGRMCDQVLAMRCEPHQMTNIRINKFKGRDNSPIYTASCQVRVVAIGTASLNESR